MATQGLEDINRAFDNLKKGGQIRTLRSATNAALNPALKALRAAAPRGSESHKTYKGRTVAPGFLSRRGIVKSVRVSKDKTRVLGNVRLAGEAWYGSLIEHGYRPGKRSNDIKKASRKGSLSDKRLSALGDNRVKRAPKPWFNPTVDKLSQPMLDAYSDKMEKAIIKEWLK